MSDPYDEDDEPNADDSDCFADADRERVCHHCHSPTAGESCGFCGNDLCPACFEMGGGFCHEKHTQEQIDAYEDEVYPPANAREAWERKRRRQARNELQALGILERP